MIGQTALYNEIVSYGHTVVMTFSQFVDSSGFFSLLSDKNYYDNIISLFESGGLKIITVRRYSFTCTVFDIRMRL